MATLSSQKGRRFIQWPLPNSRRKATLSLGRVDKKHAEEIRLHVERLIGAKALNQAPTMHTVQWVAGIGDELHKKLAAHKLVEPRKPKAATELDSFLARYIESRTDIKPYSRSILGQVKKHLVAHFGARQAIEHVNRGDARDYRRYLTTVLSPATVSMHVMRARQMFADALDRKLIAENPFEGLPAGPQTNEARKVYVPKSIVEQVIDKCPSLEWKLMFALARYAGLRTPSETFKLRWTDVLWHERRMIVTSPKTERHAGKAQRIVPIAPELMPVLQKAFDAAEEGATYVIGGRRSINPATLAKKIIARSGVTPWVKPFHNLRASCQTDWCDELPVLAVCAMIGNSGVIARKHYVSVTDEHFNRISLAGRAANGAALPSQTGHKMTAAECNNADSEAESALASAQDSSLNPAYVSLKTAVDARKALQTALHKATEHKQLIDDRDLARLAREIAGARHRAGGGA